MRDFEAEQEQYNGTLRERTVQALERIADALEKLVPKEPPAMGAPKINSRHICRFNNTSGKCMYCGKA